MTGKTFGYVRISSVDQNLDRQLEGLRPQEDLRRSSQRQRFPAAPFLGPDRLHHQQSSSSHSIDRLARNLDDLRRVVQTLTGKGVAGEDYPKRR